MQLHKVDSSIIRYFVSIVIIALGLYFGYAVITMANSNAERSSMGSSAVTSIVLANGTVAVTSHRTICNAPKTVKVVDIYPGDPKLQLQLYTFGVDDLSVLVMAHASKKGRMAGAGLHKFYASYLCSTPAQSPASAATEDGEASAAAAPASSAAGASSQDTSVAAQPSSSSQSAAAAAGSADASAAASATTPSRRLSLSRSLAVSQPAQPTCTGIVLDVGAFIGTQALVLAKMGFDVHAFEPQTSATDLLKCSMLANHLHNLHVIGEGISDTMGKECLMYPMAKLAHQAMFAPKAVSKAGCEPAAEVPVVTLDHYWINVLDKAQITLIKIDAEGHEEYILSGGAQLFKEAPPPYILVDFDPLHLGFKSSTAGSFLQVVDTAGYRVYDCRAQAEVLVNDDGVAGLEFYKSTNGKTWLLLVHKTKEQGPLPAYGCDA